MSSSRIFLHTLLFTLVSEVAASAWAMKPVTIVDQGTFAAGGTVVAAKTAYDPYHPTADNQTLHGDHASVDYQVPADARKFPLVFLHGAGQSGKTWDTTPDGRDGFRNIFLADRYKVYLVDQPRRGKAGRATVDGTISATPDEGFWFGQFRMGMYPNFNKDVKFSKDPEALNQFFRQITPNTAPYNADINAKAIASVFERTGDGVLISHSQGGGIGWLASIYSNKIKAIISFEPGSGFPFPIGEVPSPIENVSFNGALSAYGVSLEQFMELTKKPIFIIYGDYIPNQPVKNPHEDYWRAALTMAQHFAKTVNSHGGDVRILRLPEVGLIGNTHFPMSDTNNEDVADIVKKWLAEKGFDVAQ